MPTQPTGPRPVVPELTPADALAHQQAGALLVDVRELQEWQEGHVRDALHIPLGDLPRRFDEIDRTREIVTVCRSGNRSAFAADALLKAGFTQVSSMAGGTLEWAAQGLPMSNGEEVAGDGHSEGAR